MSIKMSDLLRWSDSLRHAFPDLNFSVLASRSQAVRVPWRRAAVVALLLPFIGGVAVGNSFAVEGNSPAKEAKAARTDALPDNPDAAWLDAFRRGDAAGMAATYTDDAVLMPPNAPLAQGRVAITQALAGMCAPGLTAETVADAVITRGNLAIRRGRFTIKDRSGASIDRGKMMEVWKKEGHQWLLYWDIWNSDTPAPRS